jgi:membrane protease YdiL (CAAX protease family)
MRRFFWFLTAVIPYLAAELLQYFLYSIVILTGSFVTLSEDTLYLLSALIIAVCGVVYLFWYRYEVRWEAGGSLKNFISIKGILLFIFLGVGCQFFFTGVLTLIQPFFTDIFSDYSEVVKDLTAGNSIVVLLLMIVIAPVTEELIFRGVTLRRASRFTPFFVANTLQAVLFGIYHGNIIQGIYAALLGFLLGAVYYKYKTIFAPILLHMIINSSSLLTVFIPNQLLSFVLLAAGGGLSVAVTLLIIKPARTVTLITPEETPPY